MLLQTEGMVFTAVNPEYKHGPALNIPIRTHCIFQMKRNAERM